MDGGHQKKWSTWLRCRHMCDHVNTCVTCYVLCCATLRLLRAVFTCLSVCAVPCNTVLVCAARSQCGDFFLMIGERRMHARWREN